MLLEKLGIFGWKEQDENLILSSLLTGDPLLLIGNHGSAKTLVFNKFTLALDKSRAVYDCSKSLWDDLIGFPSLEKLKEGKIEYIKSETTCWDKSMVLLDEINRALPELQSKWLEIIRSRKIMGLKTSIKWVWAAMNPLSYSATQVLDDALIGRFATFVYPPDVLQMNEEDRIKVTTHINGDDAPSISEWSENIQIYTVSKQDTEDVGQKIIEILQCAAKHFGNLKNQLNTLSEFLAKFADLLMRETNGEVVLDGRRLGFIYRNILANRSIEMAKAEIIKLKLPEFTESARYVVQSSIPVGLNDESLKREEAVHKMEICFDLLSSYFNKNSEIAKVNLIYELFTTDNLMRKAEILLKENLSEFVNCKAWNDLMNSETDITLLAYTALQIEAHRPGVVPSEILEGLSMKINPNRLSSECIPALQGESIEYIEEVEQLLEQDYDLARLIAYDQVKRLANNGGITLERIAGVKNAIENDIKTFQSLINNQKSELKEVV